MVGNIVRRVLGLVRDEEEENRGEGDISGLSSENGSDGRPQTPTFASSSRLSELSPNGGPRQRHGTTENRGLDTPLRESKNPSPSRPPLLTSHTGFAAAPPVTSMFSILSHPTMGSPAANTPIPSGAATPTMHGLSGAGSINDLRAEVIEGIGEIIDELDQADEQIANYAVEHIHPNEVILTYSSCVTVQRFLLKAASKRKFTLIHAEAYPNNHHKTHALITGKTDSEGDELATENFQKPLTAAGVTVILVPDSAVFALMSRVNKVILGTHAVLANGGLVAAAGARTVAKAAKAHQTPMVVLSGTFKLSPEYPYEPDSLLEFGNVSKIFPYQDWDLVEKVEVENPIYDFVPPDLVDLYITNLGGHAPSYIYRIVKDQYREEDFEF